MKLGNFVENRPNGPQEKIDYIGHIFVHTFSKPFEHHGTGLWSLLYFLRLHYIISPICPSLFEVEVEVGVEVEVEFEVGVEVEVKVKAQNYFFGVGGWVAGWRIKQSTNSKLKLKLELGTTNKVRE